MNVRLVFESNWRGVKTEFLLLDLVHERDSILLKECHVIQPIVDIFELTKLRVDYEQ